MQKVVKDNRLGVIGGKGKMAKWFLSHFKSSFKTVYLYDLGSKQSLKAFCEKCDIILVSVPIDQTVDVILSLKKHLREDQLVLDFCSLKEKVCKTLKTLPCKSMGMHPLFGPNSKSLDELTVAICPVKIGREKSLISNLFKAKAIQTFTIDPKLHDQIMAYVQALNHINILAFGSLLQSQSKVHLKSLTTPSFSKTHLSLRSILESKPELYMHIAFENPYFLKVLKKYELQITKMQKIISNKDSLAFKHFFNSQKKFWEKS